MKPVIVLLSAVLVLASAAEPKAEQKKQAEKVPAKPVITEVALENLKIGILEKEDTPTDANLESVATFSKLGKVLEADQTKKIYATATLKNKGTDKFFRAHQVFAIFTHESGHESTFVFDYVSNGEYKLDIVLSKAYKDFDGLSGKYSLRFVAGDALMKNPFNFVFADIKLTIPTVAAPVVPKSQQVFYEPLKEIEHQFREPEKRPRVGISTLFAIICLAPLGVLVFAWLGIGINFGNMPASIWVPIFHISLTAVFGLYIVFWLQLNMFETLKYLAIVGAIAFLSGNRVLRSLSDKRKTKTE